MSFEQAKVKAKSFFKKLLIILTLSGIVLSGMYYFYRTYTLSEGTRSGLLFKISKKGKVFKTYEGQLQLAGTVIMNKASTWEFSVVDASVYSVIQNMEGSFQSASPQQVHIFPDY